MMLLAQIILTIIAWNNGWRWLALIPMASAFIIGFIIGMTVGEYNTFAIIADIASLIAVIFMALTSFNRKDRKGNTKKAIEIAREMIEDIHKDLSGEN